MAVNNQAVSRKSGHPPIFVLVVGVLFLVFFVVGGMAQIQTNEAFITSGGLVNVFHPNWSILWQPVALVTGGMGATSAQAAIFGWGIELIYLGCIIGWEHLHDAVSRSGQALARIFLVCVIIIVLFNFYTDYQYGTLGTWGHWGFAVVASFIVGFFGTIGMHLVKLGWQKA